MSIKAKLYKKGEKVVQATYDLKDDGTVELQSVVTHGNFVSQYNGKNFSSLSDLDSWIEDLYF